MNKPYMGKILMVDLSNGTMTEEAITDSVYEQYLSGMGLGAYILFNRMPAGADPLGPDNILGFCSGLLTGTGSYFSGRWTLVGKSPLTGGWGDANCGGTFSPAIKRCGYDAIFFKGISSNPVYLYVKNGKATLQDATALWGQDAVETEEALKKQYGQKAAVAVIGPAGEKVSLISGVCTDKGRIAARSGLGAVMGVKKLKAVVLDGVQRIGAHDPAAMKKLSRHCAKWTNFPMPLSLLPGTMMALMGTFLRVTPVIFAQDGLLYKTILKKWGTGGMNQMSVEMGDSPLKNWNGSNVDFPLKKSRKIDPDIVKKAEIVKYHCYSCPLGCGGICATKGKYSHTHKPEYESVLALGGLCMNEDLDSIFYLNEFLNRAGMDTISAGATAAFAIECYEKGILTKKDTDGLELKWGNTGAIIALIEKMVKREGIGDLLADGSKVAAAKIGRGAEECTVHAGGQEPAMHDGRGDPGFNVHYSVEPTPGRHTIGAHLYYEMFQLWKRVKGLPKPTPLFMKGSKYKINKEKAQASAACSKFMSLGNGAGMCMFGLFLGSKRIPTFDWLNAATGWKFTPEEYMTIGERIQTMKQAFNVKHGIEPKNNFISSRAQGKIPQKEGANKGRFVDVEKLASGYWEQFGWDKNTGKPKDETLRKLGIK
ncbi:MAG: aldehyde ferredoxin oxidoreductase family protein [Deltaproteobacteria bacterium]|nr:aldehyde ferredoxin oxidoreductase family protein [Deltaproteobacteria bacterium]